MNKTEIRKVSKLSVIDKRVLTVYADMSMETGARTTAETAQPKSLLHKAAAIKL
jgi:hypothetical protein